MRIKRGGIAKIVGTVVSTHETEEKKIDGGWDEVALAHYPSILHFADMLASEDYHAAEKTMDELARAPNIGNCSNVPYRHINSPIKFKVRGVPELPKHDMKNNIENKGINCAIPL